MLENYSAPLTPPGAHSNNIIYLFPFRFCFFSFIYVCTFLAWLYNVSHRSPFFVSLCVCVCKLTCDARGGRSDPVSPIHDYIPTWYHEFIYNNMQYFLIPFNSYRFLIIIFPHFSFLSVVFTFLLFFFLSLFAYQRQISTLSTSTTLMTVLWALMLWLTVRSFSFFDICLPTRRYPREFSVLIFFQL